MTNKLLDQMVNALVRKDEAAARDSFSQYISDLAVRKINQPEEQIQQELIRTKENK